MIISTVVMSFVILLLSALICGIIVNLHSKTGSGYDEKN